jgi:hypothetical protein
VSAEEQKGYAREIYADLMAWLEGEIDANIEQRYITRGLRRAQQGVPFSQIFWAICIAREYLWEHIQQECLLEEPVEFWGGVMLLRSLNQFFDRVLYSALIGYQGASKTQYASAPRSLAG